MNRYLVLIALQTMSYSMALGGEVRIRPAEVPAAVMAAVKQKYATARLLEFERETEKGRVLYEVTLELGRRHLEVMLTAEGQIEMEEERITMSDLPELVRSALLQSKYGKLKVRQIERMVTLAQPNEPRYEIGVIEGKRVIELLFDSAGKLIAL